MSPQSITLYGHGPSPNPWKVAAILGELNLPYNWIEIDNKQLKSEPYTLINPNGRVPAIEDPNTGIDIWESGAIIEYLIETYDKEHTISFEHGSKEYFLAKQWLHFQMSGQGPYFGQFSWFTRFHPEKVQSAIDRYLNEIRRVSSVLDGVLKDRKYLVGDRFSYADAAFLPWFDSVPFFTDAIKFDTEFPHLWAWLEKTRTRPAIAKVWEERAKALAAAQKH